MSKHGIMIEVSTTEPGVEIPQYQTEEAAGADIRAHLGLGKFITIAPGERLLVPTGLRMRIPRGYEGQIRSRSGRTLKEGLVVLNSPGTVDSDYRGEIKVIIGNIGDSPTRIDNGDRIAQLVIAPVYQASFNKVLELEDSDRGSLGFGSTGM